MSMFANRFRGWHLVAACLAAMLLAACNDGSEGRTSADTTHANVEASQQAVDDEPPCLRGGPFVAEGELLDEGETEAGAAAIEALRWESHDGCERLVIDLAAEDGQAAVSIGPVAAELLRDLGVIRVRLERVQSVDQEATDTMFGGELIRKAYVVRSEENRSLFVDLHLEAAAEARALTLQDPARVVLDVRPAGGAAPPRPAVEDGVVVLRPRSGGASYPLIVEGYARTFEANVVARLEQDDDSVVETFTTATDWAEAWGLYSMTIEEGPSGEVELHVGEHSARDGTWEGAMVELEIR